MRRKCLAVGVILLFIETCIIPSIAQDAEKPLPSSRGNWLYVGGSGPGNYTKIQDAIDNASDGDTIYVYDDSSPYVGAVIINKSVTLIGEAKETTIIEATSIEYVTSVLSDNVTIKNFTFQNGEIGISITANYTIVENNFIKNNVENGVFVYTQHIFHDDVISGNIISNSGRGIYVVLDFEKDGEPNRFPLEVPGHTIIKQNLIRSCSWVGIDLIRTWKSVIIGNLILNCTHNGISVWDGDENTIINNTIEDQYYGMYLFTPDTNIIRGNIIKNTTQGILAFSSHYDIIENNKISYNTIGIILQRCPHSIICNNTITMNSQLGLKLTDSSTGGSIFNNTISNNGDGLYIDIGSTDNSIYNNQFFNDGVFVITFPNTFLNNSVNRKPLIYYENMKNILIDTEKEGEIILKGCDSITIQNQNLSHATIGIMVYQSTNCLLTNITSNNNLYGIYVDGTGNSIVSNAISNSDNCGIYISGTENSISNNTISNNNYNGIYAAGVGHSIVSNAISNSDNCGIYISGTDNSIISNQIENNTLGLFWYGNLNSVNNNNFVSNSKDATFHKISRSGPTTQWVHNYWEKSRALPVFILGIKNIFLIEDRWGSDLEIPLPWIGIDRHPAITPNVIS